MIEDIKDYYEDEKFLSADGFHDAKSEWTKGACA